jgi:hypothetical protein
MTDEPRPGADARRKVDLVQYAERVQGYARRAHDGGQGIVVLEHESLRDRVAMAQGRDGQWIYASVRDYAPRGSDEPSERALARLRECIERSPFRGTGEAFVAYAEERRRERTAEMAAELRAPPKNPLSQRMYGLGPMPPPPVVLALPTPEQVAARQRAFDEANRAIDASRSPSRTASVGPRSPEPLAPAPSSQAPGGKVDLSRRRYDWSPAVRVPGGRDGGPDRGR